MCATNYKFLLQGQLDANHTEYKHKYKYKDKYKYIKNKTAEAVDVCKKL